MIYAINSHRWYEEVRDELHTLTDDALSRQKALNGFYCERTEAALAEMFSRKHAILVPSGSMGIYLSLFTHGIGPGDEVIISPYICNVLAVPIKMLGTTLVFPDINKYGALDANAIERLITPNTKAIVAAGLFGDMYDFATVEHLCQRYGLLHLNDSCQSIFSQYRSQEGASLGELSVISFSRGKNLPTASGYGAILTNNSTLREHLLAARFAGKIGGKGELRSLGLYLEPSEDKAIQCYLATQHARTWLARKLKRAAHYKDLCQKANVIYRESPDYSTCTYTKFTVFVKDKKLVAALMLERDIQCTTQYDENYALEPLLGAVGTKTDTDFPMTTWYRQHALHLPLNPWITEDEVTTVVDELVSVLDTHDQRIEAP